MIRTMDQVSSADLQLAEEIVTYGIGQWPLRFDPRLINGAAHWLQKFITLPKDAREKLNFWTEDSQGNDITDDGYHEKGDEPGEDAKHIFHWREALPSLRAARGIDIAPYSDADYYFLNIFLPCWREFQYVCRAADYIEPGHYLYERTLDPRARKLSVIRLQIYKDAPGKREIGKKHYDKDLLTFHIAELLPGLRIGDSWTLYLPHPNRVLAFFGTKMEDITRGRLKALLHKVTDERESYDKRLRWSMVFFGHIPLE